MIHFSLIYLQKRIDKHENAVGSSGRWTRTCVTRERCWDTGDFSQCIFQLYNSGSYAPVSRSAVAMAVAVTGCAGSDVAAFQWFGGCWKKVAPATSYNAPAPLSRPWDPTTVLAEKKAVLF